MPEVPKVELRSVLEGEICAPCPFKKGEKLGAKKH